MSARQVQVNDWIVDRSKRLGSGTYGHVFACACRTDFCKRGAIKVIPKKNLQPNAKILLDREVAVLREIEGHPNLVRLFDAFETDSERYIIMERISMFTNGHYFMELALIDPLSQVDKTSLRLSDSMELLRRPQRASSSNPFSPRLRIFTLWASSTAISSSRTS
jgi:serine/threonine protein kinase